MVVHCTQDCLAVDIRREPPHLPVGLHRVISRISSKQKILLG